MGLVAASAALAGEALAAAPGTTGDVVDLDGAVAAMAAATVAVVLLVWCCGAAVTALGLLLAARGRTAGAVRLGRSLDAFGAALAPALLRRLVAALLGAAALAGAAGPAVAAPPAVDLTWPTSVASETAAPTATAPATTAPTTTTPATTASRPGPPATRAAPPVPVPVPAASAEVTVRPGDTLWSIAAHHLPPGARGADVAAAWPRWFEANRSTVGADPDLLRPGQRLVAPASGGTP